MGADCLDHTPAPQSYTGRQEWAAAMGRQGLKQTQCPVCGRWAIWRGVKAPILPEQYERGCVAIRFYKR